LCGHKRWKGIVKGDDEAAERLRFAGEHEYPVWLDSGRCYAGLLDLSTRGAPQDPAAGSATLASVRSLIEEFAGRMELEESREGLAKLAECAQFQALASGDLASLFNGEVTQLDEGRVRVVYNFSDPAQLRDFDRGRYARDGSGFAADTESKGMDIKDGALFAEGTACLRTHANYEGPIEVRYTYASIDKQGIGRLTLGVHDDGEGDLLQAQGAMLLWWSDKSQSPPMGSEHFDGMISYRPRAEYEIRLKLDAEGNVDLSRSGEPCIAMTNCPRKRGAVFLALDDVSGGGKLRVSELVIEGKLTPYAQHTLRLRSAARVADELR
jgi:hypothetical protein